LPWRGLMETTPMRIPNARRRSAKMKAKTRANQVPDLESLYLCSAPNKLMTIVRKLSCPARRAEVACALAAFNAAAK